jgi:hypothetical protein
MSVSLFLCARHCGRSTLPLPWPWWQEKRYDRFAIMRCREFCHTYLCRIFSPPVFLQPELAPAQRWRNSAFSRGFGIDVGHDGGPSIGDAVAYRRHPQLRLLHLIGGKLEHIFWVGNKQLPKLIAWADDLSRDGQAKNIARLHKALDAFTAIDPATLPSSDRADREMQIGSIKGKLLDVETIRY